MGPFVVIILGVLVEEWSSLLYFSRHKFPRVLHRSIWLNRHRLEIPLQNRYWVGTNIRFEHYPKAVKDPNKSRGVLLYRLGTKNLLHRPIKSGRWFDSFFQRSRSRELFQTAFAYRTRLPRYKAEASKPLLGRGLMAESLILERHHTCLDNQNPLALLTSRSPKKETFDSIHPGISLLLGLYKSPKGVWNWALYHCLLASHCAKYILFTPFEHVLVGLSLLYTFIPFSIYSYASIFSLPVCWYNSHPPLARQGSVSYMLNNRWSS